MLRQTIYRSSLLGLHGNKFADVLQNVAKARRPEDAKFVHVRSSGLKAAATWHRVEILQACRECCGGMGAPSVARQLLIALPLV